MNQILDLNEVLEQIKAGAKINVENENLAPLIKVDYAHLELEFNTFSVIYIF